MKADIEKYEWVYQILKNKIACGLLPAGTRLPGRAVLCEKFNTSERTVRRAVEMLEEEGLLVIEPKKRPVVASIYTARQREVQRELRQIDPVAANDILKTGIILCFPLNRHGILLCSGEDWKIPEAIAANMDPDDPIEFWRLSNRFWRFFVSRNENELIMRMVDSLDLGAVDLLPSTRENRVSYLTGLKEMLRIVKSGGKPEEVHFDAQHALHGVHFDRKDGKTVCRVTPDSPLRTGTKDLERRFRRAQERYSSLYLDILGLIALGRYQPGDRLPTHEELQEIYGVSIDTTIRAIRILQEWGVVTASPRNGIFVSMDLDGLRKIQIDPDQIASHVRRYFDSVELLSLTIESVSVHSAAHANPEEARRLYSVMDTQWNDPHRHQLIPHTLLSFIVDHIQYDALRMIYKILMKNHSVGRSIPRLVQRDKTPVNTEIYRKCMETAMILADGNVPEFASRTAEVFQTMYRLLIEECKRLGYYDSAMNVYDGTELWK